MKHNVDNVSHEQLAELEKALIWKCETGFMSRGRDRGAVMALGLTIAASPVGCADIVIMRADRKRLHLPDFIGLECTSSQNADMRKHAPSVELNDAEQIVTSIAKASIYDKHHAFMCVLLHDSRLPNWLQDAALMALWDAASCDLRYTMNGIRICCSPEQLILEWTAAGRKLHELL